MDTKDLAEKFAHNQIQFGRELAKEIAEYVTSLRYAPMVNDRVRGVPVSSLDAFRCVQIINQLILEMAEGDVGDLYTYLEPYVKQKFLERMEYNDPLNASEVDA